MHGNVFNCVCVNVSVNKISHNPVDIFVIKLAESIGCAVCTNAFFGVRTILGWPPQLNNFSKHKHDLNSGNYTDIKLILVKVILNTN